ncbi:MAG: hypothetical protein AAF720_02600 [Pseudomonadota bacterium]
MKEIIEKHKDRLIAKGCSPERAEDIVHRLVRVLEPFVDAAWGLHSAQLARDSLVEKFHTKARACANLGTKSEQLSIGGPAVPAAD